MYWKETRRAIIMALILALSLSAASAFAEAEAPGEVQGMLTVSYDQCVPGKEYVLIVYEGLMDGTDIDLNQIKFIDQIGCGPEGKFYAAIVDPELKECTVTLSGEFSDGTVSLRVISASQTETAVLRLPSGMKMIAENAFCNCTFTHIYLNERLEEIGARAFSCCAQLVYVDIPDSVVRIDPSAFEDSPNVVIGCTSGSAAYDFAVNNQIPYQLKEQ